MAGSPRPAEVVDPGRGGPGDARAERARQGRVFVGSPEGVVRTCEQNERKHQNDGPFPSVLKIFRRLVWCRKAFTLFGTPKLSP